MTVSGGEHAGQALRAEHDLLDLVGIQDEEHRDRLRLCPRRPATCTRLRPPIEAPRGPPAGCRSPARRTRAPQGSRRLRCPLRPRQSVRRSQALTSSRPMVGAPEIMEGASRSVKPGATYAALGVRPVINAAATLTRLGGSRMPPVVLDAMRAGGESFVDLTELQRSVGDRIAALTGNEACYVSSGAAAGMAIAVAACITGGNPERVVRLPERDGQPPEVIVFRAQRNGYDQAVRLAGVRLVEIGSDPDELASSLSSRTVCVLYFAGAHFAAGALPLDRGRCAVARSAGAGPGRCSRADSAGEQPVALHARARRRPGDLLRWQGLARTAVQRPGARRTRTGRGMHSRMARPITAWDVQ